MAKLDPPMLTEGPLSGAVFVVTHGKVRPHPTDPAATIVDASVKYDVTDQFAQLVARRSTQPSAGDQTEAEPKSLNREPGRGPVGGEAGQDGE